MAEKGTHFDANVLRSAASIIEARSKKRGTFMLGVLLRFLRSVADDIDPGCPTATCGTQTDGSSRYDAGAGADA